MSTREREKCLDVLGLPHNSSEDDIKKAYRRLAKQYHPDKNTGDGAKEQFQEISYAYKYLIEGPAAVGAEDEEEGIPLDILLRLFPWMFGAHHPFHSAFFHDPFHHYHHSYYPTVYVDSSDDEDDYDYYCSHNNFKPSSTYTQGPSKEERKKSKKKKAKERRKAAKMSKAQASPAPKPESKQTKNTSSSERVIVEDLVEEPRPNCNNNSNVPKSSSKASDAKDSREKDKTSEVQNGTGNGSAQTVSPDTQQTQGKKSKKKLKQEQKQREREMELIANEFKQKQKEQAEKDARKEEMKKEKKKMEEIQREEMRKKEIEEKARQEEKRKDEEMRREKEKKSRKIIESIDDHDSLAGCDSQSCRTVSISDCDDVSDVENGGDGVNTDDDDRWRATTETHNRYSAAHGFGIDSKGESYSSTQSVRPKVTHASRSDGYQGSKTQYKDTRSSSRGSERSSTPSQADRQTYTSKKIKRNARKKQVEADDWSGDESSAPFGSLMPQNEAEEMRMFHEALLMSERESKQQGVIPETEEEERRMLEAALRESQISAQWGTMDSLDDVSDCDDGSLFGAYSTSASSLGAGLGNWHQSIGCNTSTHNKENETPAASLADTGIRLGGYRTASGEYRSSDPRDQSTRNDASSCSQSEKFDKAVGGKVKVKSKAKDTSDSWEFGGGGKKPLQSANAQGLQFGLDDFGSISDEDDIPKWARETSHPSSNQYGNQQSSENFSYTSVGAGSKQKQSGVNKSQKPSTNSHKNPANQNLSQPKSSKPSPASAHGNVMSTGGLGDMDDIDDVDTLDDSSVPSFGSSAEPASSFDLNIPAAFSNMRMKSFYQRRT